MRFTENKERAPATGMCGRSLPRSSLTRQIVAGPGAKLEVSRDEILLRPFGIQDEKRWQRAKDSRGALVKKIAQLGYNILMFGTISAIWTKSVVR
jgi:hypothetical protein